MQQDEAFEMFQSFGLSKDEFNRVFNEIDENNDNSLQLEEWINFFNSTSNKN